MAKHNNRKPYDADCVLAVCLTLIAFFIYFWGIKQNLPYAPEVDEKSIFVGRAVMMASTGNANPNWFGNPGSTVIYPLALAFRLAYGEGAQQTFETAPSWFYFFGRLLSVSYSTMSIPLIYLFGKKIFEEKIGLLGAWFFIYTLLATMHFKIVRTDSAALFWGLVALWRILVAHEKPTLRNQILAGGLIGLSVASRYFMITLAPVLLLVNIIPLRQPVQKRDTIVAMCAGFLTIGLIFAVSTPYFFLDFSTALDNLRFEARTEHIGADGLSKLGNFWWYISAALPEALTWPQYILAIVGICFAVLQKRTSILLLGSYLIVFLFAISLSGLHWARWLIQILPLFNLFSAFALFTLAKMIFKSRKMYLATAVLLMLFLTIAPIYETLLFDYRLSRPSTRVLARNWIIENLPPGSHIFQEAYAALLANTNYEVSEIFSLSQKGTLDFYTSNDYRYLVTSDNVYNRYFLEPERYSDEVTFYNELFENGHLLTELKPSNIQGGYTIRIYEIIAPPP
ncbi:MAG: glycosyltransferase family 39 protein [Anaerolineaceae bacterium]|nr:glycosyltransferase family 39 protein [Anaerolineaceae bacterium]